ncbi:MAG: LacI family DNA-binding transcriptional regulator [Planctomycetota bacterium]
MPTVRQIAQEAGVSAATVSRVLNQHPKVSQATRDRVLQVAVPQGDAGAPVQPRQATRALALMYTGEATLGSPFDAIMLAGISNVTEEAGFDVLMLNSRTSRLQGESHLQMLRRKGIKGVLVRTNERTKGICRDIARERFPMVVIGERFSEDDGVRFVYSDSRHASREAIRHLIEQGHSRIAVIMNVVDDTDHLDRVDGWRQAHADHGLQVDDRLILRAPARREGGVQAMKRLAAMPEMPTAVYIIDPLSALGVMNQALAMGIRVPDQLAVVGFDDGEYRYSVFPQMTAVCQNTFDIGRESAAYLLQVLNGTVEGVQRGRALPSWFEVHDSSCAIETERLVGGPA